MKTVLHRFEVCAGGNEYILNFEKPDVSLVSMEYYFTYHRAAVLSAHPRKADETVEATLDRFIPQAYFPDLIKSAVIRLNTTKPPSMKTLNLLVEAIASRSTQFPALVIEGKVTSAAVKRLVEALEPVVKKYNMYFLLLLRMKDVPADMDSIFHAHREVYYSSRNQIFIKCLLEIAGAEHPLIDRLEDLKKRNITSDILMSINKSKAPPDIPDLAPMIDTWFDSYSERDIHHGPNVWIELKKKIAPSVLLELDRKIAGSGVRRLYLHPSLHRLMNGYATIHPGGIRGSLVFSMDGSLHLEDMGEKVLLGSWMKEQMWELLARQPKVQCGNMPNSSEATNCDETQCKELRHFCLRSPMHCEYMQQVVEAIAKTVQKTGC